MIPEGREKGGEKSKDLPPPERGDYTKRRKKILVLRPKRELAQ